jgi:hypothetical protein
MTSDMYEGLLSRPINPHTNQELPIPFQHQLRSQLELLKQLGISTTAPPISVSEAVDSLNINDEVTNKNSQFIVETIIKSGIAIGLAETKLRSLDIDQMNTVLATIGMKQSYLPMLTPNHAFTVFCRAAYVAIMSNSNISKTFFLDVTLQTSNPKMTLDSINPMTSSKIPIRTEWIDPISASRNHTSLTGSRSPESKSWRSEDRSTTVSNKLANSSTRYGLSSIDRTPTSTGAPAYTTTYNDTRFYSGPPTSHVNPVELLQTVANT